MNYFEVTAEYSLLKREYSCFTSIEELLEYIADIPNSAKLRIRFYIVWEP